MKNLISVAILLLFASTFLLAGPSASFSNSAGEKGKELRREKRKERRETWSHTVYPATEARFADDFPGAKDITWRIGEFVEATFIDDGVIKTAYYDTENELVGTTTDVTASALPLKAQEYISKKYPGYKIGEVIFFDDNEANDTDMLIFNQSFEDRDNYFPVLTNETKTIILKVSMEGEVSFFGNYK